MDSVKGGGGGKEGWGVMEEGWRGKKGGGMEGKEWGRAGG